MGRKATRAQTTDVNDLSTDEIRGNATHRGKDISRALIPKALAWPAIEQRRNPRRIRLRNMRQRFALREELADEPIQVLVRAPLLRAVGVREIDATFEELLDRLVPPELDAVVAGDRFHRQPLQR